MRLSWKLGRIAGIDVFVHPTFLLVLLFPGVSGGGALAAARLSVFGCVLLHEFGHALMARRFGIETEDITLYPIGGVARLQRMPRAPGAELLIALAGPAVNFAIVGALTVLGFLGLDGSCWRGPRLVRDSSSSCDREPGPGPVQPDPGVPDGRRPRPGAF